MPNVNVVLFQRDTWWIAQCLEHDIGAQAFTVQDALRELDRALVGHIAACMKHGLEPFEQLPKAPAAYWKMWESTNLKLDAVDFEFTVPLDQALPKPAFKLAA